MELYPLPTSFVNLILALQPAFTSRAFGHLMILLVGLLYGNSTGKRTVWGCLRLFGEEQRKRFSNTHRFLSRSKWKMTTVGLLVVQLALSILPPQPLLTFTMDETLTYRSGRKIYGRGRHYDGAGTPHRKGWRWGHVGFVGALVGKVPGLGGKVLQWLTIPFAVHLYEPPEVAKGTSKKERRKVREGAWVAAARKMLEQVVGVGRAVAARVLIVVVDGSYACQGFLGPACSLGVTVISRMRVDATLYGLPPEPEAGVKRRGRRKWYGEEWEKLPQIAAEESGWEEVEVTMYGHTRRLGVKTFLARWKSCPVTIRLYLINWQPEKYSSFFCTDPDLPRVEVLERIAARWGIELGFREVKQGLGFREFQGRVEQSVKRGPVLACVLYSLIQLWGYQQAKAGKKLTEALPWYDRGNEASCGDVVRALKREGVVESLGAELAPHGVSREVVEGLSVVRLMTA